MIYYDTITGAKFDANTQQQLKYVAVSRARENVYIVTDNKLNDPVIVDNADKNQQHIKQWSKKEGWSEEYFKSNVLPKMLKNNDAYQVEFKLAEDQNIKADFRGQMNFDYNDNKRSDIKSTSTIEAIMSGERTATTRYSSDGHMDYWNKVKTGDIIEYNRGNKSVKVVVTKPFTKLNINNFMNLPKQLDINFDQSVANLAELGKQRKNECNR